jgi:hypothetical protein
MRDFAFDGPSEQAKRLRTRKRYIQSMVLPAPAAIQAAQKHLDYQLYPDNPPERVQRLHDSVQSIAYRLQSVEIAHDRITRELSEFPEGLVPFGSQVRESVQRVFEQWASFESGDVFDQERGSLQQLSRELHQQLDVLSSDRDRVPISDRALGDLYTLLGTVRGLISAMANAQAAISQINWHAWTATRL